MHVHTRHINRGVGAYPEDSFYDPGRPSWLPYWIDTPTESAMKWPKLTGTDVTSMKPLPPPPLPVAYEPPPGATDVVGPSVTVADVAGEASVDAIIRRQAEANRKQFEDFVSGLAADEASRRCQRDGGKYVVETGECQLGFLAKYGMWLAIGAAGVLGVVALGRR